MYDYYLVIEPGDIRRWGWHNDKDQYTDFGFRDKYWNQSSYISVIWAKVWTFDKADVNIGFA